MDFLNKFGPQAHSLLRIVAGLCFLEHGVSKYFGFPAGHVVQMMSVPGAAGAIELVAGALILLGLFSRFAAFIASGEMAFAYFMAHFPKSPFPLVNGGDAAILFCFIFLYIACAGPGPWALNQK